MAGEGIEKRKFNRLDTRVKVEVSLYDTDEGKTVQQSAQSRNVSAGGLLITMDRPLGISTFVMIRFTLPGETRQHDFIAKVVRVEEVEPQNKYDNGLEFVDLITGEMQEIDKYVSEGLNEV